MHYQDKLLDQPTGYQWKEAMAATLKSCLTFVLTFLFLSFYTYNQRNDTLPLPFKIQNENQKPYEPTPTLSEPSSSSKASRDTVSPYIEEQKIKRVEEELANAKAAITSGMEKSFVPRGSIYHNAYAFYQSHREMLKSFKVWAYREGEPPLVHEGPRNSEYGIEGYFMDEIERGKSSFSANDPEEAHAFFLPISITNVVNYLSQPLVPHARDQLIRIVTDYMHLIAHKYPFWNRTKGADHFLLSCHHWAADISKQAEQPLYKNLIAVLCSANTSEGFKPARDVSLPEINLRRYQTSSPRLGQHPLNRSILAFFAGGVHGRIRETLMHNWKDKDERVQVHEYLPQALHYHEMMERSKFCLCPSGHDVASPRLVESIYAGCVPVIIADYYEPPFCDVLDWSKFSLHIPSEKIWELKNLLRNVSQARYMKLQRRVIQVQIHFQLNRPAKPFDVFHMILHSVWLRRISIGREQRLMSCTR